MERIWSTEQQAIFSWFKSGHGNLVVRARAGTGKTTTIIEASQIAPEGKVLLGAFNKSIATELQSRIKSAKVKAKTLHGLGYAYVMRLWGGNIQVDGDGERGRGLTLLALANRNLHAPFEVKRAVTQIHTKLREMYPRNLSMDSALGIMARFDLMPDDQMCDQGFDEAVLANLACEAAELAKEKAPAIDFADMIFLPLAHRAVIPWYDMVIVDESQDMTMPQLEIAMGACKRSGRIVIVGDDRQCQPAGSMVETTGGRAVPIESLRVGDRLVSYHDQFNGLRTQGKKILDIAVRHFDGQMLTIHADAQASRCTPEHLWPTRLDSTKKRWAVYAMERGATSRLGCTQLMYNRCCGVSTRCHQERADKAWILRVFDNRDEARIFETVTALKYGLPEEIWYEKGNLKERILEAIGSNRDKLELCLSQYGRSYSYPLWAKGSGRKLGTYIYNVEACNLIEGVNLLRTFDGSSLGGRWAPCYIGSQHESCDVYSISVEPTDGGQRLYVADGILTHNCIYGFRGADQGNFERLKNRLKAQELGLTTTYRCPKRIVTIASRIVPDFKAAPTAPEGEVVRCSDDKMRELVGPGDFILSRLNAPLVPVCMSLLKMGKRATIKGRDIGKGIKALIDKLAPMDLDNLTAKLGEWHKHECERALKKLAEEAAANRIAYVTDQKAVCDALIDTSKTVPEVRQKLETLFADDTGDAIVCSTVHRSKGLESTNVWLLEGTFRGQTDGEEANLRYVAITRTKNKLAWVSGFGNGKAPEHKSTESKAA